MQPVPEMEAVRWAENRTFLAPGPPNNTTESIRAGDFVFLNHEEHLGWPPSDWNASALPRLWQYNLHYFDWLWGLEFASVREGILHWISRHPLGRRQVGWEAYPISLRLMNWCAVCFGQFRAQAQADSELMRALWHSIYLQAEWLLRHLEAHLLGNHLFENGAALAFVGSCFGGAAGARWLEEGLRILDREIPEQILPDGMHFERSPMYHVRITYLLRLLQDTGNDALCALVAEPLVRMRKALACLCHPDGGIALLNDSAFGVYPESSALLEGDCSQANGAWALPDAGYYGWRGDDGAYIVCDAGPIGPDYIPGHAHGDMFSFELSLKGQRVIVDSGVYDYVAGPMREYCRSTRAHNTVEINDADQCEFWGAFRVGKRGSPREVEWDADSDGFRLSAWHDGYARLPGGPVHRRTIHWEATKRLVVCDQIRSRQPVHTVSRLHFHPSCEIERVDAHNVNVRFPAGQIQIVLEGDGELRMEDAHYCPEFGRREPNIALAYAADGTEIESRSTVLLA